MEVHVFVISWKGQHHTAAGIEGALREAAITTHVVYSDPDPDLKAPFTGDLTLLPDATYWAEKFDACLRACRGERMLVIHADTSCADWPGLVRRCLDVMKARPEIGVWAPMIEGAYFNVENAAIKAPREDSLIPVANTDGIVFCLAEPERRRMAKVDYSRNTFGWGIAWLFCCAAYGAGRSVVVDGRATVSHRQGRGYDTAEALRLALRFLLRELRPAERIQFELLTRYVGRIF